jgi:hypothetical protein
MCSHKKEWDVTGELGSGHCFCCDWFWLALLKFLGQLFLKTVHIDTSNASASGPRFTQSWKHSIETIIPYYRKKIVTYIGWNFFWILVKTIVYTQIVGGLRKYKHNLYSGKLYTWTTQYKWICTGMYNHVLSCTIMYSANVSKKS